VTSGLSAEALWPYALEVYARPGVEPLLLRLQDEHGQCVPLLSLIHNLTLPTIRLV
jgi:uncharacterized protein (TIGR02444 family)